MRKLKYLLISIALISNVLLSYKLSIIIINKKTIISTKIEKTKNSLNNNSSNNNIANNTINNNTSTYNINSSKTENVSFKTRDFFYSLDDTSINRSSSEHFQVIWGNDHDSVSISSDFIKGILNNLETMREVYIDTLEMKDTSSSTKTNNGSYKTNIYLSDTGLKKIRNEKKYSACDNDGFAYMIVDPLLIRVDPPSWILAKEYAHAVILHQGGSLDSNWSDAMANWFRNQYLGSDKYSSNGTVYGPASSFFKSVVLNSNLAFPQQKNAYDSWPFITYISENPDKLDGLGLDLIHNILEDKTIKNPINAINKKTKLSLQDVIGNYSKRMITMDYTRQKEYLTYLSELQSTESNNDLIFTNLDFSSNTWVTVPYNKAPQQGGYNVIPIKDFSGKSTITVEFHGIKNKNTDDWRGTIVAYNKNKTTTYSSTWNDGKNTMKLSGNETALYLIVAATPKNFKDMSKIDTNKLTTYPYKVKVSFE